MIENTQHFLISLLSLSLPQLSQKTSQRLAESQAAQKTLNFRTHILDIKSDYRVIFDFSPDMQPTTIVIEPLIKSLRSYRLACQTPEVSIIVLCGARRRLIECKHSCLAHIVTGLLIKTIWMK